MKVWPGSIHLPWWSTARLNVKRFFTAPVEPVELEYDKHLPHQVSSSGPLVILHGLFGSKRNWGSLSKAFCRELNRPVYALDLRNQGSSPHVAPMTYQHMAADVLQFCKHHSLSNISLLGHSMGGKVAMSFALSPELPAGLLSNLIVSDISPAIGDLSAEFKDYITAMKQIQASGVTSRKEAQDILGIYEKDASIRAFLLTNFIPASSTSPRGRFRIPLDIVGDAISELGSFPYQPGERAWNGRTLFVKGSRSKYINHHNLPLTTQYFPNKTLEALDTGHWVHAERPNEFKTVVMNFINSSS